MRIKVLNIFKKLISPLSWISLGKTIIKDTPGFMFRVYTFTTFFILLFIFFASLVNKELAKIPLLGKVINKFNSFYDARLSSKFKIFSSKIEKTKASEIKRTYLIEIAQRNLTFKKTRTAITILGMSVGVGIIVLLLSLGYGIEKLIIDQVATLDELKVIDVSASNNTALHLDKNILQKIVKFKNVAKVMPIASLVAKVGYNNASSDVVVYSTSNEYMQLSHIKLIKGKLFSNNDKYTAYGQPDVAGVSTKQTIGKIGDKVSDDKVYFNVVPATIASVYSSCTTQSDVNGFTIRIEGGLMGIEYWGNVYNSYDDSVLGYDPKSGSYIGKWIKTSVPLFYQTQDGSALPYLDSNGRQKWEEGCLKEKDVQVTDRIKISEKSVLGVATESSSLNDPLITDALGETSSDSAALAANTTVVATNSGGVEVVALGQAGNSSSTVTIPFKTGNSETAIVSSAFLKAFNIPLNKALGTSFTSTFTIVKALLPSVNGKAQTPNVTYKIIGVTDDESTPYFYIPLHDINSLDISNFSQFKTVIADKNFAEDVRKKIETLGFRTSSTLDTVAQIESLFGNIRIILGLLGFVALGVASLGMFNTLTVSLLERTREIGGMKTMGMVSSEVEDLFLAEAMMIGMAGGVGGLILGYLAGKFLSLVVSLVAISNGQPFLNLTYIPVFLTVFIIISSFVVGIFTGFYPSKRARQISALDALRYE